MDVPAFDSLSCMLALVDHASSLVDSMSEVVLWAQAAADAVGDGAASIQAAPVDPSVPVDPAAAGEAGAANAPQKPVSLIQGIIQNPLMLFAGLMFLFYMMVLLPERRKQAETARQRTGLKKNDRVVTTGGILGVVVNAAPDSDEVTIRVDESNNTRIRVLKSAISSITPAASSNKDETANA